MKNNKTSNELKKKKAKKMLLSILLSFSIIVILAVLLIYNLRRKQYEIEDNNRYALIDKSSVTLVYEDKLAVEMPADLSLNKEMTIKKLINSENYKLLLNSINEVVPEKVNSYKLVSYEKPELNVKQIKVIPSYTIDDKKYILTTETQELFENTYLGKSKFSSNILVDILNANGVIGYARETGEKLKEKLHINYTAANYEKNTNYSLIRINDIEQEKLEDILVTLSENYYRVKKDEEIPTLANVVIILGKEEDIPLKIDIIGRSDIAQNLYNDFKRTGYKNLFLRKTQRKIERNMVEYNKEDYYTALKISKKFNIRGMQENNNLKNKINIYIK